MNANQRLHLALVALIAVTLGACKAGGAGLAEDEGVAAGYMEGEGPGARIDVVEAAREARQAAPTGEAAVEARRFARPEVTVYDPPPDLSRWDVGVVYVPPAPSASPPSAPPSGAGDTVGATSTLSTRRPSMSTTSNRSPNASNESPAAGMRPR
jgi:hypothetical protein